MLSAGAVKPLWGSGVWSSQRHRWGCRGCCLLLQSVECPSCTVWILQNSGSQILVIQAASVPGACAGVLIGPGCGEQLLWWRNAIWVALWLLFSEKVVWCWCMNEVENPKVPFFRWKNILNWSGRDLKLLRSCVFYWTWECEGKALIRDCIHWSKNVFQSAFLSATWAQKVAVSIQTAKKSNTCLCPHLLNL